MKNSKLLSLIMVLVILLSSSINVFAAVEDTNDQAREEGFNTGYLDGLIKGAENSSEKIEIPYYNISIPSSSVVYSKYREKLKDKDSNYKNFFYIGYFEGYRAGYEENYRFVGNDSKPSEASINYGTSLGTSLGEAYGFRDYYSKVRSNWSKACPTTTSLKDMYDLKNQTSTYRSSFYSSFRTSFQKAYESGYEKANLSATIENTKSAYEDGKTAGLAKGEVQASHDYIGKKANNSGKNILLPSEIIVEYDLRYQSKYYREAFIAGFLGGFTERYSQVYNQLSQKHVVEKSVAEIIPKTGGIITTKDGELTIEIEKNTFYNDVIVSIETISDSQYRKNTRHIKASKLYNIEITNTSGEVNNDNKIKLSFTYFDNYRGGVYKKIDNTFVYINSQIEDDKIITDVSPSTLTSKENIYCLQIDKNALVFPDARGNWANDEINTLVRRNVIYGYTDGYFRPESNVTRGEFLTLLSRVYNWNLNQAKSKVQFKDHEEFGNRDKIISYAVDRGYIKGYSDNTFKANNPISYIEIEIIMRRVLRSSSFRWNNIASSMMYEKQQKSNSYTSMDYNANRAEIVYMLYILNEWRY